MNKTKAVLGQADDGLKASLARLFEFLRFASIGTDPAYHGECRKAAEWMKGQLEELGFAAELRQTTGQPVVIGKTRSQGLPSHAPHILFYGHYDVQPPDPLELWESPPFEPQIRTGKDGKDRIFARGACDDKGQLMTFIEASRAWLSVHGRLPFRLTVLIEGDEEGDNAHLDRFIKKNRKEFAADAAFICDTGLWMDERTPFISTRLRGCLCEEVTITGPAKDLHSGYYGGPARNPIRVLNKIIGELHDDKGRVAIPGFYDGVAKLPAALRRAWARLDFSGPRFLKHVGLSVPAGEQGYSVLEQLWARPTAELNGIHGGYQKAGFKTVLPSKAAAKVSFRTVGGQDPKKIRKAWRDFVKARLPGDCMAEFQDIGGDNLAVTVADDSPIIKKAARALAAEWGREPIIGGDGGSIPIVATLKHVLGIESLLVGFARDDFVHSPNEKYDVECFHKGIRSWVRIIGEMDQS
jgi:acetylornithine deacetylase/succinyl-diaminopimelate desuccinylase-like protein